MKRLLLVLLICLSLAAPTWSKDDREVAATPPVAIVAATRGTVSIKRLNLDWAKAYPLDLLRPEDSLRTDAGASAVVIFLSDDHREALPAGTVARVAFRELEAKTAHQPSRLGGFSFEVPYVTEVKPGPSLYEHVDDMGEAAKEQDFLSAYVKVTSYPPVFHWRDANAPKYRLQLFNETGDFIYEMAVAKPTLKWPYRPPFRLIKSGLYYWQVLDPKEDILVRKYGFRLLTLPLVKLLSRAEREFDSAQRQTPGDEASFTELFLVYNQTHAVDKLLHHLHTWATYSKDNPYVRKYLSYAYLLKGCPLKARDTDLGK